MQLVPNVRVPCATQCRKAEFTKPSPPMTPRLCTHSRNSTILNLVFSTVKLISPYFLPGPSGRNSSHAFLGTRSVPGDRYCPTALTGVTAQRRTTTWAGDGTVKPPRTFDRHFCYRSSKLSKVWVTEDFYSHQIN